jgi:DNA-binding transcriptional regulator YiaG
MRNGTYHYTESGLETVFLQSGFDIQNTSRGKTVTIQYLEGLHLAIGLELISKRQRLTGKEFRFLRTELLLSQANLAKVLGVKELTVARWEKEQTEIPVSAEAIVRTMFAESTGKKGGIRETLERIADLEDELDRTVILKKQKGNWVPIAA